MKNLVVIDNFYRDPSAVRKLALTKARYFDAHELDAQFSGTESRQSFYNKAVVDKIERAIGDKIVVDPKHFSFAVFCKTFARDERSRIVHVDQSDWTGLVYLSRPEDCRGGTTFYKHNETRMDLVPPPGHLTTLGYHDRSDFIDRFVRPEGKKLDRWSPIAHIGMKFNRMVLFRAGDMFHAADGYFGTEDENCRLIQLFFFKTEAKK